MKGNAARFSQRPFMQFLPGRSKVNAVSNFYLMPCVPYNVGFYRRKERIFLSRHSDQHFAVFLEGVCLIVSMRGANETTKIKSLDG